MLRRELLIGGVCGLAAATAYALKPHRRLSRLGPHKLAQITPAAFGGWTSLDVSNLIAPTDQDSQLGDLYDELVEKTYVHAQTGAQVMTMLAHGGAQTNDLQVHRPENCYPAFGFVVSQVAERRVPLRTALWLPARQVVADAPDRRESIVYWVRMGDSLPTNGRDQRMERLHQAMSGFVSDGLLARFSMTGADSAASLMALQTFIPQFLTAVPAEHRPAFVGANLASAMAVKS